MSGSSDRETLVGGDGNDEISAGETGGDALSIIGPAVIRMTGAERGIVTRSDGSALMFSGIEDRNHIPCFTPGTKVQATRGEVDIEDIVVGDRVPTLDRGDHVVRRTGVRRLFATDLVAAPNLRAVRSAEAALGPDRPERGMVVSPHHRILVSGLMTDPLFGEDDGLLAVHLVGGPGIVCRGP